MSAYILQRFFQAILVLLLVSLVVFLVLHLSGDPVSLMIQPGATQEDIDAIRAALGLDRPLYVQYLTFLARAIRGDLGHSLRYRLPCLPIALQRMPATIQLALVAMGIALIVALPAGVLSAVMRNSVFDLTVRFMALIGQAVPFFWLAIMFILIFAVRLHLLPVAGRGSLKHLVMPAVTLSTWPMARITRILRSSLLSVLEEEYMTVARAKGLGRFRLITAHALKNASLPVVTDLALQLGALLNGAIITETIFGWPGFGRLVLDSVAYRDYPMVQASVMIGAVIFVTLNLMADISYAFLDPRVRYG